MLGVSGRAGACRQCRAASADLYGWKCQVTSFVQRLRADHLAVSVVSCKPSFRRITETRYQLALVSRQASICRICRRLFVRFVLAAAAARAAAGAWYQGAEPSAAGTEGHQNT